LPVTNVEKNVKTLISMAVAAAFAVSLSGCNTISGAGRDVARGGEAIQDASLKVRADWRAWRDRHWHDYDEARAGCARMTGPERDSCYDRARADYRSRWDEARARFHRNEMRSSTDQERAEDAYENARYACYQLRGADEDRCLADARARYRG